MRFTIYQESRQGSRNNNEDRTTYCYSRDALLMVVADGMGVITMARSLPRSPSRRWPTPSSAKPVRCSTTPSASCRRA